MTVRACFRSWGEANASFAACALRAGGQMFRLSGSMCICPGGAGPGCARGERETARPAGPLAGQPPARVQVSLSHKDFPSAQPLMLSVRASEVTVPLKVMKRGMPGCFIFLPVQAAPEGFMP